MRRTRPSNNEHREKKVKAIQIQIQEKEIKMGNHKRIWHPPTRSLGCCAGAGAIMIMKMKSPLPLPLPLSEPLGKMSFGNGGESVGGSLTCWPRRKRLLPLLVIACFLFLSSLLGAVGGSEDWTGQCPSGCKCTWVSGKKWADCKGWTGIPSGLSPEVQVLDMSGSNIKLLQKDAFKSVGLVNLQKVFLTGCRIERIDRDAFRDLSIMIELDLSGNLVSSIDMETFESNVRLRELKLSKNPLSKLTGPSFPPLGYLKLLDLSECQLSSFPRRAFDKLSVLETLALSGNRFTFLSKEVLRPLTKLKSLTLSGNPWKCDCRLKAFRDWVMEKNLFQHHTKCAEPPHVTNFPWDQLVSPDFACRPEVVSLSINGKPTDALLVHTDVGSDITLQCLVRGQPPPELKWVRDGQVLTNNSRSHGKPYYLHIGEEGWGDFDETDPNAEYRGRWVNLTIQKTDPEDASSYTCVGSNAGGVVEKNLTLNFQDVPSGAGVGHGLGGLAGGAYRESGWIWILVTALSVLVLATLLVTLVCFCSRRRRVKTTRGQDLKSEGREDQPTQRQLLLTPSDSEKLDEDMLIMKDKYLVGPDSRSKSTDMLSSPYGGTELDTFNGRHSSAAQTPMMTPPRPPSASLTNGPHHTEYPPDLLDLPHHPTTRFQEGGGGGSPAPSTISTAPDTSSIRMLITPQHMAHNPAIIVNPSRLGYNNSNQPIYSGLGRTMSPFFSPAEPVILPGGVRPGYVTLPRRNRVPSWSPSPGPSNFAEVGGPPSPTGSAATISSFPYVRPGGIIKYDNLGPRTTADGSSGSRLSLNSFPPEPSTTPKPYHHPALMTGTLGRHNMLRSTPTTPTTTPSSLPPLIKTTPHHFPPIQEVEPVSPGEDNVFGEDAKTDPSLSRADNNGTLNSKKVPPKPPPKPGKKKVTEDEAPMPNGVVPSGESEPSVAIANDDGTEV